jgi:hypothetical protein
VTKDFSIEDYYSMVSALAVTGPQMANVTASVSDVEDMELGMYMHLRKMLEDLRPERQDGDKESYEWQ